MTMYGNSADCRCLPICSMCGETPGPGNTSRTNETERALKDAVVEAAIAWRETTQPETQTHLALVDAVDALAAPPATEGD